MILPLIIVGFFVLGAMALTAVISEYTDANIREVFFLSLLIGVVLLFVMAIASAWREK